jgi:hypothetical protein
MHYVMELHIGTMHNAHNLTLHNPQLSSSKLQPTFKVADSKIKLEYNGNAKQIQRKTRV